MKKLLIYHSLLLLAGCASMEQTALHAPPSDHHAEQLPSPIIASHSCNSVKASKGNTDEAASKLSKSEEAGQESSFPHEKRRYYRELYALNTADVLTGERCTLYAQDAAGQQSQLVLSEPAGMLLSAYR